MSDPKRLVADGATTLEHRLLRSWKVEEPSAEAKERVLAAVAIAGLTGAGSVLAPAAQRALDVATTSLARKALLTGTTLAKISIAGVVGVVAVAAAIHGSGPRTDAPTSFAPPNSTPVPTAPSPPASVFTAPTTTTEPTLAPIRASDLQDAPEHAQGRQAIKAPPPVVRPAPETSPPTDVMREPAVSVTRVRVDLAEQIQAIDAARAALAQGDYARGITLVDDYDRLHPNGVLEQEATLLRIEALMKSGDEARARDVASRFLAAHPKSAHAAKVRGLIEKP
jgi:hypothetical protein